jgi:hypothetical protein
MRPAAIPHRTTIAALAVATALFGAARTALADTATSGSFQIQAGTIDTAGGRSTSASHVVTACVGSEVAGSASSASFRIDSGCGATALLALPKDRGMGGLPDMTVGVPTLSDTATFTLAALLAAAAAFRLRRRRD